MSERIIQVTVSPAGETQIETEGFTGTSCRQASRFLEQALGKQLQDVPTLDFYQIQTDITGQLKQGS